jgi:hypothetical protein
MEYLDKLAELAVKEAIAKLVADGKRPYSQNVPPEALRLLLEKARGRVSPADADKRVPQAIERLKDRKEIKAPNAPYNDWTVIDYRRRPAPTNSSA